MFGTNMRIELQVLGFIHIIEICFHPQMFGRNIKIELKMFFSSPIPEISFHPQNVWYKYEDRIESAGFYTHHRNMFPPQMLGTNIRIELKMLSFSPLPEICFYPQNVWHEYQDGKY